MRRLIAIWRSLPHCGGQTATGRSLLRRGVAVVLAVGLAAPGHGHQLRAAITTALFNPRSGDIEVMHRFFLHDAEHALGQITGRRIDLVDSAEDRLRFAVYVHERFDLHGNGARLEPLTLVGGELDGDFLWVYQRTPAVPGLTGLTVRSDALRDVWADQVNTLNVERDGTVRSLVFAGDRQALRVDF